ncbi:hypothetical protein Agub_g4076 [Astrephomene gubernaculifera]|uniref:Serine protease n=1 Tax=Astrephomene gubernaculifera TaxID=47775 RepID=A0AAD3HIY7_9CHLO|nr:hypothetical protein Agub_g4076 [Astrephomene gubernaculifera]
MDPSWSLYNMARLQRGLDAFANPADLAHATELRGKQLYERMCPLLVKIYARSQDGQPAGEFSGFLYSSSCDSIISAAHIVGHTGNPPGSGPPAELFKARYFDGFEEDVEVLKSAPNNLPDVAILRGSRRAPRSLGGMLCSKGETVYAFGFSLSVIAPCISNGVLSNDGVARMTIAIHADSGYLGGPVVNVHGKLVGIINGGLGTAAMQVVLTPGADVHTFLLQSGQPGLA